MTAATPSPTAMLRSEKREGYELASGGLGGVCSSRSIVDSEAASSPGAATVSFTMGGAGVSTPAGSSVSSIFALTSHSSTSEISA